MLWSTSQVRAIARINSELVAVLGRLAGCYRVSLGFSAEILPLSPWRTALAGPDADKLALELGSASPPRTSNHQLLWAVASAHAAL